jgi:hypothetical protein
VFPYVRQELRDLRNVHAGTRDAMDAGMRRLVMALGSIFVVGCDVSQQGDSPGGDAAPPPVGDNAEGDAGGRGSSFDGALAEAGGDCTSTLIYLVGQDTDPGTGQGKPLLLYSYDPSTNDVHTIGTIPCATNWWWNGWWYDQNGWWGASVPLAVDAQGFAWLVQWQGDGEAGTWSQTLLKVSTADASCIGTPVPIQDSVHAVVGATLVPTAGGSGETLYVSAVVPPAPPDGGPPPPITVDILLGTLDPASGDVAGVTPIGGVPATDYLYYKGVWPGALAAQPNGHVYLEAGWNGTMNYDGWLYDVDPANLSASEPVGDPMAIDGRWTNAIAYWKSDVYLFGWWDTSVWKFDPSSNTVATLPSTTGHWIVGASAGTCPKSGAPK